MMDKSWTMGPICFCLSVLAGTPDDGASQEIPRYSTPQNVPCADQPRSIDQLVAAFGQGHSPGPGKANGTWVAIGFLSGSASLNCAGITRGGKVFETVIIVDDDRIEIDRLGTYLQTATMTRGKDQTVTFAIDDGADAGPEEYGCRLTKRGTLACLAGRDEWIYGIEF